MSCPTRDFEPPTVRVIRIKHVIFGVHNRYLTAVETAYITRETSTHSHMIITLACVYCVREHAVAMLLFGLLIFKGTLP